MARAEELVRLLYLSESIIDGNEDRNHITGLEHSLRVATLARRWIEGAHLDPHYANRLENQVTFMGLVHDLARPLSDPFHGEVIAEIVRDMVDDDIYHVLRTHGEYQARFMHKDPSMVRDPKARYVALAEAMCAWEIASFADIWVHDTMTRMEAVTLIYKICDGRN
jgi:hypothetical protein